MKSELDKLPEDLSAPENAEKIRAILKRHVAFLQSRLDVEPDDMERKILKARIDNLIIAQKQLRADLMEPGHG